MAENAITQSLCGEFARTITKQFSRALDEFRLVKRGDSVCVCVSGGKDSMLMSALFRQLESRGCGFSVRYLLMDPGYSADSKKLIYDNAKRLDIPLEEFKTEIFKHTENERKNPCFLCSKMRRGHLYAKAQSLGCNKIALGHHFDDVIESTLMGVLYGGQAQTMLPRVKSRNFAGMELIRPMFYIRERDILAWCEAFNLQFPKCSCSLSKFEESSKREFTKRLIARLCEDNPQVAQNIFHSVQNVRLDRILSYKDERGTHDFLERFDD